MTVRDLICRLLDHYMDSPVCVVARDRDGCKYYTEISEDSVSVVDDDVYESLDGRYLKVPFIVLEE